MICTTSDLSTKGPLDTIRKMHAATTCSKYKLLEMFVVVDSPIDAAISNAMSRLQNAAIQNEGLPGTPTLFKITTAASLSTSIANSTLSVSGDENPIFSDIERLLSDEMTKSRITFLTDLVPNLSATCALQWFASITSNASNSPTSTGANVESWFQRVLGDAGFELGRHASTDRDCWQAPIQHALEQIQFLVKAPFIQEQEQQQMPF